MPLSNSPSQAPKLQAAAASPSTQVAHPAASGHSGSGTSPVNGVDSTDILRGEKAVAIHHKGLTYRLQATRLGKLILTK